MNADQNFIQSVYVYSLEWIAKEISDFMEPISCDSFFSLLGPGPGRYKLPSTTGYQTHDITKYMKPAYSFGIRYPSCKLATVYDM